MITNSKRNKRINKNGFENYHKIMYLKYKHLLRIFEKYILYFVKTWVIFRSSGTMSH